MSPSTHARHWALDPSVAFLNHGSFGACPTRVLEFQSRLRARLEREPVVFFVESYDALMDESRAELARFLGARPDDLVFVPNATTGVATALAALEPDLRPGDELLAASHEYPACLNNLRLTASRSGATVVIAPIPFPISSPGEAEGSVLERVTPRTRVALLSHVTSPTGIRLPVESLAPELERRGVRVIIDGAHAAGQVPGLTIPSLGASYYTTNAHKWLCTPKGSGVLWVREDLHARSRPLVLSNHAEIGKPGRSRLHTEFDYVGTSDPTAYMSVGEGIRFMASLLPGGWEEVMASNHRLVIEGRGVICRALEVEPPAPDEMLGSMSTILLPDARTPEARGVASTPSRHHDALQDRLVERWRVQVPIWSVPGTGARLVRISAQVYNSRAQYERLAHALRVELGFE